LEILQKALESGLGWLPTVLTALLGVVFFTLARKWLEKSRLQVAEHSFRNQAILLSLTFIFAVFLIQGLPITDIRRGQIMNLLGLLVTAAIALSSATIIGNAMGGIMLRAVRSFRIGDFVTCGQYFGRVTEIGLFHTEIQTEDRTLITLPNLHVITHPLETIRSSGTIVSATVSLGYDIPRSRIEPLLIEAATAADLEEPFVQCRELGDFSVTWRIAGMLPKVKRVITARSRLRKRVLDHLHGGGIEIVSPTFMNTRAFDPEKKFISRSAGIRGVAETEDTAPEEMIFDKADEAATLDTLRRSREKVEEQIKTVAQEIKDADDEARPAREERLGDLEKRLTFINQLIEKKKQET
jgi:small-conductance mechanosensitive channel